MRILTANARVLLAVLENPEMTQKQIADMLGIRYQHVWRALDRLVKENILQKERKSRRTYFYAGEKLSEIDDIKRLKACIL
jgi:DNA-binding MarR family transcriptional regulator